MISYQDVCEQVLGELQPRARDIVARRFGLGSADPQTLEAIGSSYGITRERVRQVADDAVASAREKIFSAPACASRCMPTFRSIATALEKEGLIKREDLLIDALNARNQERHAIFLLVLAPDFHYHRETRDIHAFWTAREALLDAVPSVIEELVSHLAKEQRVFSPEELEAAYQSAYQKYAQNACRAPHMRSALEISKHIAKGHEGKWGLRSWPQVHPRGIREKAYVVLKKEGKPLHFSQVAKRIEDLQRALAFLKEKPVLPQTVHNELIKDPRFALVGRGMYGLSDWGYREGTVKDVVRSVLGEHAKGLLKNDIVRKVLSQRNAKEATVLLALQDRSLFSKDDQGRYHLV